VSGLLLSIPDLYEVRVADVEDDGSRYWVYLEARQMINNPPGEWKPSGRMRVGNIMKLSLLHESHGTRP
jgi:hypothetical protein